MKRFMQILLNVGLVISAVFGLGHFIIPAAFNWNSFMDDVPRYIAVSIDWINYILSLLLTGYSILLIVFQSRIKQKEKTAISFFGFLVFVYLAKSIMVIVIPWGMAVGDVIEISSSILEFVLLLIPFMYYIKKGPANPEAVGQRWCVTPLISVSPALKARSPLGLAYARNVLS